MKKFLLAEETVFSLIDEYICARSKQSTIEKTIQYLENEFKQSLDMVEEVKLRNNKKINDILSGIDLDFNPKIFQADLHDLCLPDMMFYELFIMLRFRQKILYIIDQYGEKITDQVFEKEISIVCDESEALHKIFICQNETTSFGFLPKKLEQIKRTLFEVNGFLQKYHADSKIDLDSEYCLYNISSERAIRSPYAVLAKHLLSYIVSNFSIEAERILNPSTVGSMAGWLWSYRYDAPEILSLKKRGLVSDCLRNIMMILSSRHIDFNTNSDQRMLFYRLIDDFRREAFQLGRSSNVFGAGLLSIGFLVPERLNQAFDNAIKEIESIWPRKKPDFALSGP